VSDEPKELFLARVKDCHRCLLQVGSRLGYVPKSEKRSITRMEHVAARKLGMDLLVFMADEKADGSADSLAKRNRWASIRRWQA
jgi:hypothetical protein